MTWEEIYNLIFAVCFILIGKVGDHIEEYPRHYSCPPYCDVDHIHIVSKENKDDKRYNGYPIEVSDSLYIVADVN